MYAIEKIKINKQLIYILRMKNFNCSQKALLKNLIDELV